MNVRLKKEIPFTAGIYYKNSLRMNNYLATLWLMTNSYDPEDHTVAFERLKYFLYNQIDSSVFIDQSNVEQCQKLVNAGVRITTLPGDPVDQLVGIVLYSKLNAIMENRMILVEIEMSSIAGENVCYLHSEEETSENLERPPWTLTADLVQCDTEFLTNEKIVSLSPTASWRDLDLCWNNQLSETTDDNTVVFANFKKDDTE
jgi:hypothetical protein